MVHKSLNEDEGMEISLQTKSESTEETEREGEKLCRRAPDGGWGWLCVIAAFVVNVITDGCSYSFGILFVDLIDYFGESRSKTAWIGSLFAAVPLLCGPLASLITNKLGYRKATILGGFITLSGFVFSNFVTSIDQLYITYGILAGLGISLPYLNSIVVVADYFEKKRAFATGLAECGAGVGTLIFAPILERLIEDYGWRGAILVMGGIASNIIVCGATFRPLHPKGKTMDPLLNKNENENNDLSPTIVKMETITKDLSKKWYDIDTQLTKKYDVRPLKKLRTNNSLSNSCISIPITLNGTTRQVLRAARSVPNLDEYVVENEREIKTEDRTLSIFKNVKKWINISVMYNPVLIAFTFTNFLLYFWYDVPYVFLVDRATSTGITSRDASYIVACVGILHLAGNIMFGFLGDRPKLDRSVVYCVGLILCGCTLFLVPFTVNYAMIMVLAGSFGLLSAAAEALGSVIIADIVGVNKLTDAFGTVMFLQGVANLVGPPFAGFLFDASGSYDATFWAAGSCISGAAAFFLVIPVTKRFRK